MDLTGINRRPQDLFDMSEMLLQGSQRETFPYDVEIQGRPFAVFANVFSPKHLPGAGSFFRMLPPTAGLSLLEVGTGVGAVAVLAALAGATRVVATDISADAVANARFNAERHGVADRVDVRLGDVYDPLGPEERFDLIFWNMPFGFVEPDRRLTPLQRSNLDPGYAAVRRYITEGPRHLTAGGLLTLGFSLFLGRLDLIEEIAAAAGLTVRIAQSEEPVPERPYDLQLFQFLQG